jgi:ABC-type branched-subunit amino acid transport system substrate-binding protein
VWWLAQIHELESTTLMGEQAIRVGFLRDVHSSAMHDFGGNAVRMLVNEANAGGGLHGRPVELVTRIVGQSAAGTHDNVAAAVAAWNELVHDKGVLGIIGPSTTPVAVAVHEAVERTGVPCIHWAGTDRACGGWHFQFQAGSLPDEGAALAFLMARHGRTRAACFRSEGDYGQAYLDPFLRAAEPLGIELAAELVAPLTGGDMAELVARARSSGADAVVAMGLFGQGVPLARALRDAGWNVACYGNIGFALIAGHNPRAREVLKDWWATDQLDPHNRLATEFFTSYEQVFGVRPATASTCFARDCAAPQNLRGPVCGVGLRRSKAFPPPRAAPAPGWASDQMIDWRLRGRAYSCSAG